MADSVVQAAFMATRAPVHPCIRGHAASRLWIHAPHHLVQTVESVRSTTTAGHITNVLHALRRQLLLFHQLIRVILIHAKMADTVTLLDRTATIVHALLFTLEPVVPIT